MNIRNEYKSYGRRILLGMKYWIYYLYDLEKIDEELTIKLINQIGFVDSDNIVEDILFLIERGHGYMSWDRWDQYRKT